MNSIGFVSEVDSAFIGVITISIIIMIGVTVAMLYFIYKYHHTRHTDAQDIHGNTTLEIVWTIIPTILVLAMFWFGFAGYSNMHNVPDEGIQIEALGRMWSWQYTYENGIQHDKLVVPAGENIILNLKSNDVIHSFYIPALRVKKDVVPGLNNRMWFMTTETGNLDVFCAEYCGDQHAYMSSMVEVLSPADYQAWYEETGKNFEPIVASDDMSPEDLEKAAANRGKMLAQVKGCIACHSSDGTVVIGPSFKGLYGSEHAVIENGEEKMIVANEEYIRGSIRYPDREKVKGFENMIMTQIEISDEEIDQIIAYMKSLE